MTIYKKIILVYVLLLSACSNKNEQEYEKINMYILNVILGVEEYNIGSNKPIDLNTDCKSIVIEKIGLDKVGSQREVKLFHKDLNEADISNCRIILNEYEVIQVSRLKIIEGVCCVKSSQIQFEVGYSGLLNEEDELYTMNCAYVFDRQTQGIKVGCENIGKSLQNSIHILKRQINKHDCD